GDRGRVHRAALHGQASRARGAGAPCGALSPRDASAVLRLLRRGLSVQARGKRRGAGKRGMIELADLAPDVTVRADEYQRLLGYPRERELEERALELADE